MARRAAAITYAERVAILKRAAAGETDAAIAAALDCSRWTVRKWRRIGQRKGRAALAPRIGRPPTGPLGSLSPTLRHAILQLRRAYLGWGATTLLAELRTDPLWSSTRLPSRSRIAALISYARLTRRYNRHSELPQAPGPPQGTPHDGRELDAQGPVRTPNVGKVCLVNVIDTVSRLKLESYPCLGTTNPPLQTYQLVLRRAFLTFGLPKW